MRATIIRLVLRAIAILIAVAAIMDPSLSARDSSGPPVVAVRLASDGADAVIDRLRAALPGGEIVVRDPAGTRVPCAPGEHCLLIADGRVDADVPPDAGLPLALIRVPASASPNVAIRDVVVPAAVHASAAVTARVELSGVGVAGHRTEVRAMDGDAIVGSAAAEWPATMPAEGTSTTIELTFWPATPGGAIRIEAVTAPGESTLSDNAVDVGLSIQDSIRVLIVDTRPSWPSTFVRRALQDDPRFDVSYRTIVSASSRAVAAGTVADALSEALLEQAEVVIASGLDSLSARDVSLIDRFVQVRGGTAILLPDRRPAGEAVRLMPGEWREELKPAPERVGPLRASEILTTTRPPFAATVIGRLGDSASIVARPHGEGRIMVSGAMDAWRYRHLDAAAFDRFWRSIVAETGAASRGLQIDFDRRLAAAGARVPFTIRHRRMRAGVVQDAQVLLRCGNEPPRPVRVWPSGDLNVFTGEFAAAEPGTCRIAARANAERGDAGIAVVRRPTPAPTSTLTKLERAVAASGGVIANADDDTLTARLAATVPAAPLQAVTFHPMRSPWWIAPFALLLSIEWWLRRRAGIR